MAKPVKKAASVKKTAPIKKSAAKPIVAAANQGVDWRSLYLYAVSLITLLVCLFTVISLINRGLDLIVPDAGYVDPYAAQNDPKIDPDVIKQANIDQNRRNAIRGITSSIVTLIVTIPVYLYHWKWFVKYLVKRQQVRSRGTKRALHHGTCLRLLTGRRFRLFPK